MKKIQPLLDCLEGTAYTIDGQGHIVAVGQPRWDAFAHANAAAELAEPGAVIGRPLLSFFAGDEVRSLWQRAIDMVRDGRLDSVALPCRCDSPTVERHMRVALTPLRLHDAPTLYLFQAVVLDECTRPAMNLFLPAGGPQVAMCSFCHAIRAQDHDAAPWQSPDAYYAGGGTSRVTVSHSVCPGCRDVWLRSLGLGG